MSVHLNHGENRLTAGYLKVAPDGLELDQR